MSNTRDLLSGRNGAHRYNINPAPPEPEVKLKKDGTPYKVQPKRPKPSFDTVSVTTISGLLAIEGLPWAAAKETAIEAVDNAGYWQTLDRGDAVEYLRKHHRRVWDVKAETGNIVHDVALAWAHARDVDLGYLLDYDQEGRERGWTAEIRTEVLRRVDGCLMGLERFYRDQRPQWQHVERTVIHPGQGYAYDATYTVDPATSYAGAFDAHGSLRLFGEDTLLDWKTGGRYLEEVVLQVAGGYNHAPLLGTYDTEGHLIATDPYDGASKCAVVYLSDTGNYEIVELPQEGAHEGFMAHRAAYAARQSRAAWARTVPAPVWETVEAAADIDAEMVEPAA